MGVPEYFNNFRNIDLYYIYFRDSIFSVKFFQVKFSASSCYDIEFCFLLFDSIQPNLQIKLTSVITIKLVLLMKHYLVANHLFGSPNHKHQQGKRYPSTL